VAEAVVDVAATVIAMVIVAPTDDVMPARRAKAVPLASSSPSSVAASDVVVVLLLLPRIKREIRCYGLLANAWVWRTGASCSAAFYSAWYQNGIRSGEIRG
jgi:hypothetical protein